MTYRFDADRQLLEATARRHSAVLPVPVSVSLSAAVDALSDPLTLPALAGADPAATDDLLEVIRAVHRRLLHTAGHSTDPQQTLAAARAARELADALHTLTRPAMPARPGAGGGR